MVHSYENSEYHRELLWAVDFDLHDKFLSI